jgi:hypothetical protein
LSASISYYIIHNPYNPLKASKGSLKASKGSLNASNALMPYRCGCRTVRWLLVKNMLTQDRWKYRDVAQESVLKHLWQNVTGFLFDKD